MIRFADHPQPTACPVEKKAIFENRESDQSVARLANANFGLAVSLPTMLVGFTRYSMDDSFSVIGRNKLFLLVMAAGR